MPALQVTFADLNVQLGPEAIKGLDPSLFAEGVMLSSVLPDDLSSLGFALDSLPTGIHEAIRAVLHDAVSREMPVTIAWAPGYDYKLNLWDVSSTDDTLGGITMLVETRYPDDGHPINGTMQEAAARRNSKS
jgi:hypothetical protein